MSKARKRKVRTPVNPVEAVDADALAHALRLSPVSPQARSALARARHARRRWEQICTAARKRQTRRLPLLALQRGLEPLFWKAVATADPELYGAPPSKGLWFVLRRVEKLLASTPPLAGRPRAPDPALAIDLIVPIWRAHRDGPISAYRDGAFAELVSAVLGFEDPAPAIRAWFRAKRVRKDSA